MAGYDLVNDSKNRGLNTDPGPAATTVSIFDRQKATAARLICAGRNQPGVAIDAAKPGGAVTEAQSQYRLDGTTHSSISSCSATPQLQSQIMSAKPGLITMCTVTALV